MKVLLVSSKFQPEYSGSGFRAHNTYKRLNEKYNIEYDVLCNSLLYQGNTTYTYDSKKIYRISLPYKIPNKKSILRYFMIVFSIIWEVFHSWRFISKNIDKYDLLHTFGNTWSIGFLTWYFYKKKKPIIREIVNEIENPMYPIQFTNSIVRIFKGKKTLLVAISKKLEKIINRFDVNKVWTRPNPIDETKFYIDSQNKFKFRESLCRFNKEDIVLCYVANYRKTKNHIFLLDLLAKLPNNFKLVLAGPLKEENKNIYDDIEKKIKTLKLEDRIDLQSGFVDNFEEYLKMSDLFLFPSTTEGLGTPILESQACGIPVIANLIDDVTNTIINDGKGGYCVELETQKWIETIEKVLDIPKEILIENANYIYNISSSKIIDEEYYQRIKELINE